MASSAKTRSQISRPSGAGRAFEVWNRKAHYYLGLYFLLFVWLFAFTGLLLNHPKWTFADFWPSRKQSTFERRIERPRAGSDLQQAEDILKQLDVAGEIEWTKTRTDPDHFDFRANRPNEMLEIRTDLGKGLASVHRINVNAWGVMRILHTFTGVRAADERNQRDWFLTELWALAMDAVAIGLIVMTLGSYYMWFRLGRNRISGALALVLGVATCGLFAFGLRLLF